MRTFTVTHIQRPFSMTKDFYGHKHFTRMIDFYSVNEKNELLFHWQHINIALQDKNAFKDLIEKKMVIELPTPIEIPEGKSLWLYYSSYLYIADTKNPSDKDMQIVCKLADCWDRVPGATPNDERQFKDIVVIKHLLTPAEGYPTEEGLLRAMTFVTTTLTEDVGKNYHFGPKNYHVFDREKKWEQWEKAGRIIDLETPILYEPKNTEINGFIKGEKGFWTDSTKSHHYGIVPEESKYFFITHVLTYGRRPAPGCIQRRTPYAGYYYIFDVDQTEHGYGDGSLTHQFASDVTNLDERVAKGEYVRLPKPWRATSELSQTWVGATGNVYVGHATKPNEHPYMLLMHSPVIETLPQDKLTSVEYADFV